MNKRVTLITTSNVVLSTDIDFSTFPSIDAVPPTLTGDILILTGDLEVSETAVFILQARQRYSAILYISKEPNSYLAYLTYAVGGFVYKDDGTYLDTGTLEWLVQDVGTTGLEIKGNKDLILRVRSVLKDFLDNIKTSNVQALVDMLMSPDVSKTIEALSKQLLELITTQELEITDHLNVLENLSRVIEDNAKMERSLSKQLEDIRYEYTKKSEKKENTGIDLYPTYLLSESPYKVMYVKKYSEINYLNTFLLSYADYLKNSLNKTVKVLFVIPKHQNVIKKFSLFPTLSPNKISLVDISAKDIFVTSEPSSKVWEKFFSHQGVNVYIVIDLTFSEPLLKGSPVKAFSAVGSSRDLKTFSIRKETAFTFLFNLGTLVVEHINSFKSMNKEQKLASCYERHKAVFATVDRLLGVVE